MAWRWFLRIALAGCAAGMGCAGEYGGGHSEAAVISPRSTWRAAGDLQSVASAIDQNPGTAAVSTAPDGRGTITIDLGKPCLFNMVVIEHGSNEMGFARRVAVLTSMDGEIFTQRYAGVGTRRVTILYMGTPVLARFVRLRAIVAGEQPWSVAEVFLQ
jgi:hypothetical protein